AALTLPLRRLEECPSCHSELHVCRLCVEYDTSKAKHCREPTAEEVRDKEHANFCDFFKPRPNAWTPPNTGEVSRSKSELEALFGQKDAGAGAPATPADEGRKKLEDLFKR